MTQDIQAALNRLIDAVSSQPEVRAIGRAGGSRPLPEPGESDIDLFVYCRQIPPRSSRQQVLDSLSELAQEVTVERFSEGHWGVGDSLTLARVETWLLHFTVDDVVAEVHALLQGQFPDRVDNDYYPIGRCAMLRDLGSLYDPDGVIASLKRTVSEYPEALAHALVEYHLNKLDDTEDIDRAARRGDVLFYHWALDLALDHWLQLLFALNRTFFPSRKRSLQFIRGFEYKPTNSEERLAQIIELGAHAETISESCVKWLDLVAETRTLVSSYPVGSGQP